MSVKVNEDIICKIAKGDEHAFAVLYNNYYTYLYTIAIYYLVDRNDANEVVNDLFVRLWLKREELPESIHTYMVRSIQNSCLNFIRSRAVRERVLDEYQTQLLDFRKEFILANLDPLQNLEMLEIEQQIEKAVETLPPKCNIIFRRYFFDRKSAVEIAVEMQLNINTVRVQIKNALDRLKKMISF